MVGNELCAVSDATDVDSDADSSTSQNSLKSDVREVQ